MVDTEKAAPFQRLVLDAQKMGKDANRQLCLRAKPFVAMTINKLIHSSRGYLPYESGPSCALRQ
jgi:hypothetical protein